MWMWESDEADIFYCALCMVVFHMGEKRLCTVLLTGEEE